MLLLDVGNTSIKWAICEHQVMEATGRFQHQGGDFEMLAGAAWRDLQTPARVVVANVAGSVMQNTLSSWAQARWSLKPVYMSAADKVLGVTNAYLRPADLGVDRWAALIAAHASVSGAVCIVDCGTAVTVDFLAAGGDHRGGMILPGVAMLERMLLNNTADIKLSGGPQSAQLFSTGTAAAVHGGAVYMVTAAIERIIADIEVAAGTRLEVIITGGDAGQIQSLLTCSTRHDPDLVLKGLAMLAGEF